MRSSAQPPLGNVSVAMLTSDKVNALLSFQSRKLSKVLLGSMTEVSSSVILSHVEDAPCSQKSCCSSFDVPEIVVCVSTTNVVGQAIREYACRMPLYAFQSIVT